MEKDLLERVKKIKLLACDVDGVLTDGLLYVGGKGEEMKAFHAHDGLGMKLAQKQGLLVTIITGKSSQSVISRAEELGLDDVHLGIRDKLGRMKEILQKENLSFEQVAFIGDDLNDLYLMEKVGLAVTVPNGAPELKAVAHYITGRSGGRGAVREVVELLLKGQGRWPY